MTRRTVAMRKAFVFFFALSFLPMAVSAAEPGVDAGSFVRFGIGARALGMGGAFVALADDSSAVYWNPAGLAFSQGFTLGGMYTDKFSQGIQYQFVSLQGAFKEFSAALSLVRQAIEGIPFYGEGENGTFSEYQNLWLASFALEPITTEDGTAAFALGANVKYYLHELLEGRGRGFGFDVGLLLRLYEEWGALSLGAVSRDVRGTVIQWKGTGQEPSNNVPWVNSLGICIATFEGKLRLVGDVDLAMGRSLLNRVHLGAEIWPVQALGIRGGLVRWLSNGQMLLSAGASFHLSEFSLSYAFVSHPVLGTSHLFSVEFNWAPETEASKGQ